MTTLRYPRTIKTCKRCLSREACFDDDYCGACGEEMDGKPAPKDACKTCGAPHGVYIQRSLANPVIWIRGVGGAEGEPGFGENGKSTVLSNGFCRYCFEAEKAGRR